MCRMSNDRAKSFQHMKQGSKYMDLSPEVRSILFREDIFHDRLKLISQ